jgi:uncharacterized protein DUF4154
MTQRGRQLRTVAAVLVVCAAAHLPAAESATADQIKAAYLFNFAKFVEWPAEALPQGDSVVTFCALGLSPVVDELDSVLRGKTITGHRIALRRLQSPEEIAGCHIVFLAAGASKQQQRLLKAASGHPVLLVGDSPGFAQSGGAMNFVMESGKVLFEVNTSAVEGARLKMSAKLLALARIVATTKEGQGQ